jgi:hypothetical protein
LAEDVAAIRGQVTEFTNMVDQYIAIIDNINATISQVEAGLDDQLGSAKTVIIIAMLWILLAQLTPLGLGWDWISRQQK